MKAEGTRITTYNKSSTIIIRNVELTSARRERISSYMEFYVYVVNARDKSQSGEHYATYLPGRYVMYSEAHVYFKAFYFQDQVECVLIMCTYVWASVST